jgi:hypothetical protein
MLAIVIENNVGSASTFGRAHGNRLRTGEGAQMINWPIGGPPPAATVTVGDLTWGWRCVEVNLSLDPGDLSSGGCRNTVGCR